MARKKRTPKSKTQKKSLKPRSPRSRRRKSSTPRRGDDLILKSIVRHYLESRDFNGLPVREMFCGQTEMEKTREHLEQLVRHGKITMEFGLGHPNPHIKAFPPNSDPDHQIAELRRNDLKHACAYPTPEVLASVVAPESSRDRPFTRRLMLGEAQLDFHAFDLAVLEFYRNDPRYYYENDDVRGTISIKDAYADSSQMHERDQVLLETFGFGYDKDMNRAVVVFTRYLHDLSAEHQQIWNAKRLEGHFSLHPDYYRNSILGDWGTRLSLFDAFIQEIKHVNAMLAKIGKPPLFRNEFQKRPRGFSFLVRPTTKEFNDFVLLLDQMMSDNINKDFFRGDIDLETETQREDGKVVVTQKGTIQLLEQWFMKKMRFPDLSPLNEMVATFREVRKARQTPAHKAEDSVFDQSIFKQQRALASRAYDAVRTIRLMLANHPVLRDYEVPKELFEGAIWSY